MGLLLGEVAFCANRRVGESGNKWQVLEQVDIKFWRVVENWRSLKFNR